MHNGENSSVAKIFLSTVVVDRKNGTRILIPSPPSPLGIQLNGGRIGDQKAILVPLTREQSISVGHPWYLISLQECRNFGDRTCRWFLGMIQTVVIPLYKIRIQK